MLNLIKKAMQMTVQRFVTDAISFRKNRSSTVLIGTLRWEITVDYHTV